MQLRPEPLLLQDEDNLAGVTFSITGLDAAQDGTYITFKPLQTMPEVTAADGRRYRFSLQRVSRPLPFSIRLDHFEQRMHPGTRLPQAYRSDVTITDGAAHWQTSISMNEPLRYRGYTLYQASFVENQESTNSVLTVVRDRGQIFPYLAIACACIGMLIHLVTLARRRRRQPA
jgi:cytochrome c biogenesis protein ResB